MTAVTPAAPAHPYAAPVFVIASPRGDGLRASIGGHLLELADPSAGNGLAPTPDDLLRASIASDVAWFARRFLRDRGHDDYVGVTARPSPNEGSPDVDCVDVTLTVSKHAAAVRGMLSAALEREVAGRFPTGCVRVQVDAE
jgi:hypothetical protein